MADPAPEVRRAGLFPRPDAKGPTEGTGAYEIVAKKPSELFFRKGIGGGSYFIPDPALEALIARGYGFYPTFGPQYDARLEQEFGGDDLRRQIYIAYEGKKAVGSLTLGLWRPTEPKGGHEFWQRLRNIEEGMFGGLQKLSPLALEVEGTVTLPESRGKGVQHALWKRAISDLHPSVILGETKNPDAVVSRAKNLAPHGFETYFGNSEVTPGHETFKSAHHHAIRDAYLAARGQELNRDGVLFTDDSSLSSGLPDISHAPEPIAHAFKRLVDGQRAENSRMGKKRVAVDTLISVDSRVHDHPLKAKKAA